MTDKKKWRNWTPFKAFNKAAGIYSISNELKRNKKIDDDFEVMLSGISLEELIGLRLEIAARGTGNKYFGLKIWHSMIDVTRDAVALYAYSSLKSMMTSRAFLGVKYDKWKEIFVRYAPINYFLDTMLENRQILTGKKMTREEKERQKEIIRYSALLKEKMEWIKRNKKKKEQTS